MRTKLNFEDKETKELLSKLEIDFFLRQNIEEEGYKPDDIITLNNSFDKSLLDLKKRFKQNRTQANYYLEGQVRKMFTGGFLPALFHLDESRKHVIFDFHSAGNDLAYFKLWQNYYKKKVNSYRLWNYLTKTGSILAIVLTIIKLFELILN